MLFVYDGFLNVIPLVNVGTFFVASTSVRGASFPTAHEDSRGWPLMGRISIDDVNRNVALQDFFPFLVAPAGVEASGGK